MKRKRKSYNDNGKLRVGYFRRKLGLLTLEEFCTYLDPHGAALVCSPPPSEPDGRFSRIRLSS
jgi:hypothetical protein